MDLRAAVARTLRSARRVTGSDGSGSSGRPGWLAGQLDRATRLGCVAVALGEPAYPDALATIHDPPPILWLLGQSEALAGPAVAIVGSRRATPYGLEVAGRLATDLAGAGVTVVSGLARGVDSAAHRAALAAGGRTVAILGSGLDVVYPPEHRDLAREISLAGAVASEFPPGTPPRAGHFPRRNRIISGLSQAIVVIEASERSGSLITARLGLEQGREVMAVPGSVLSGRNRGTHALLKDGAKLVEDVVDILEELRHDPARAGAAPLEPDSDPLLAAMAPGEAYDLDTLVAQSGLAGPAVLSRLLELEMAGRVTRLDGGQFVRGSAKW